MCHGHLVRLFLVESNSILRRYLRDILQTQAAIDVCGEAASLPEAVPAIAVQRPQLAVVEVDSKAGECFLHLKRLRHEHPELRILVFTVYDNPAFITRIHESGAHGYVLKNEGTESILEAVKAVAAGDSYPTPACRG